MPAQKLVIPYPQSGVNRSYLRSNQNQYQQGYLAQFLPQSCWDALNWLPYDSQYNRLRGGLRQPVIALNGAVAGVASEIQGLIVASIGAAAGNGALGTYQLYIDRLGVPEISLPPPNASASSTFTPSPGYVQGLESMLQFPLAAGPFVDVSSSAIGFNGAAAPSWSLFVNSSVPTAGTFPTNSGSPPVAMRLGQQQTANANAYILPAGGAVLSSPAENPNPSLVATDASQPMFETGYTAGLIAKGVMLLTDGANFGVSAQVIGVATGYLPHSGTLGFQTECAYATAQFGSNSGTLCVAAQLSTVNPASPAGDYQNAATNFFTGGSTLVAPFICNTAISLRATPGGLGSNTYTAELGINNCYLGQTVQFNPVNSSPFELFSYGTQKLPEYLQYNLTGNYIGGTLGQITASGIATYTGSTGATGTWSGLPTNTSGTGVSVSSFSIIGSPPNYAAYFTLSNFFTPSSNTFNDIALNKNGIPATIYGGSSTSGLVSYKNSYVNDLQCLEFSIGDARIFRETFPYTQDAGAGLDKASANVWSSYYGTTSPYYGPLVQALTTGTPDGTAWTPMSEAFSSYAAGSNPLANGTYSNLDAGGFNAGGGFSQGVFTQTPGYSFSILSSAATSGIVGANWFAGLSFSCVPQLSGGPQPPSLEIGLIFTPPSGTTYPAYEVVCNPITGSIRLQHWTLGDTITNVTVDAQVFTTPYNAQADPIWNIGLSTFGGVAQLLFNGAPMGPQVITAYDIGAQVNAGNVQVAFGCNSAPLTMPNKFGGYGTPVSVYGISILPGTTSSNFGLLPRLVAVNGGMVSIYSSYEGTYSLLAKSPQVFGIDTTVSMCFLDNTVYAVDGDFIMQIDLTNNAVTPPVAISYINDLNLADGTISVLPTPPPIPVNCAICAEWRGCLCLSGQLSAPTAIYISRIGYPTDFDFSQVDGAQAYAVGLESTASEVGVIPSPVTALMPSNADIMLIGCSDSVWAMTGDPRAGGIVTNINRGSGVFSQSAWCRDDLGNLYWANNNGLFLWSGSGTPTNLSYTQYDQFFKAIDITQNTVCVTYDPKRWYIWITVTPTSGGAGTHLVYDLRGQGFWPVSFPASVGPTATTYMTGGPQAQREIIFGGQTGGLFTLNTGTFSGTGDVLDLTTTAIPNYITLGPFNPTPPATESIISTLDFTLGEAGPLDNTNSFSGTYTLAAGGSAYDVTQGTPYLTRTGTVGSDWNHPATTRLRGAWYTLQMAAAAGYYLSMEHATLTVEPQGRQRSGGGR
jgi:hypothetical protein